MRCTNCGYDGEPENGRCEKCNFPVRAGLGADSPSTPNLPPLTPGVPLKGTIPAAPSGARSWDGGDGPFHEPSSSSSSEMSCSSCGYMLSVPGALCPSCGAGSSVPPNPLLKKPVSKPDPLKKPSGVPNPNDSLPVGTSPPRAPQNKFAGTIDPYDVTPFNQRFRLVPVVDGQEKETDALEYTGPKVKLNRENVDPGNPSITSKVQASIVQVDGVWYILDKSALRTTFVQAGSPVPIKEGDVIIVGNRRFVFR